MMVVMVGIFFGLQYFRAKSNPQPASPNASKSAPAQAGQTAAAGGAAQAAAAAAVPAGASAGAAGEAAAAAATGGENKLYRVTFSNRGGDVTSWILKRFKNSDGQPLDLVHHEAAQKVGFPLSLYTYDEATTRQVNEALYVASATGTVTAPSSLSFKYSGNGLTVTKTFSFDESYLIHADVAVTRNGAPVRALISWPGGFGDQDNAIAYNSAQIDTMRDGKLEHLAVKKISNGNTVDGSFEW